MFSDAGAAAQSASPYDVELLGVSKSFGSTTHAVHDVTLRVERGIFLSLLGPSGCGKTTTLRLIAGFEQPTTGRIMIRGQDVAGLPPYRRDVNTVFQSYALFPHMTVADNIAYGLRQQRLGRDVMRAVAVDGSDEAALTALMRGQDVVVNTMTYHFGMAVTRAAIRNHARYVDLGGLHNTPRQLELDAEAKAAGATIVLGCGATPGVINVLARRGVDDLDTVEAIHIAFASHRSIAPSPGLLDTVIDEFSPEASRFYWADGNLVEVRPFDGARTIDFQQPVGQQEVYFVPHSETRTLPLFIGKGIRHIDVRGAWRPEIMQALRLFLSYRLITSDVTHINGVPVRAKEFLRRISSKKRRRGTPRMTVIGHSCSMWKSSEHAPDGAPAGSIAPVTLI